MINKIFNEDCLEGMKRIPDGSIDAIITDPPFGTTACKWDTVIPFDKMWEQLKRIIKPNGAIVLFGSEPFSSALRMSNIKNYKYDWVWEKNNGTGFYDSNIRPIKIHENILVFSNYGCSNGTQNKMIYYPQGLVECGKLGGRGKHNKNGTVNASKINSYIQKYMNYPNTILKFKKDKALYHPTQKPVALIEYLIRTYTNEGETVLDFTMGSGTTAIACINTNRNYIGFELDKGYFDIANERIAGKLQNKE